MLTLARLSHESQEYIEAQAWERVKHQADAWCDRAPPARQKQPIRTIETCCQTKAVKRLCKGARTSLSSTDFSSHMCIQSSWQYTR